MATQLIEQVFSLVNPLKAEFEQVCSEPSINFRRESEFAMQIFASNDYLAKVAIGNGCMPLIRQLGLTPSHLYVEIGILNGKIKER